MPAPNTGTDTDTMYSRPDIHPLYRPIDEHDAQEQARADAYRARVRDAALRLVAEICAELLTLSPEQTGYRIGLRGCVRSEVRRAAENGATREQINAALTNPPTDPEGHHPVTTEFVRFTLPNGNYAQWIDHGTDRPALVNLYSRHGYFTGMDRTSYETDETTAQAIARLTTTYPDAHMSRLNWDEAAPGKPSQYPAAAAPQTPTEEGQTRC